MPTFHYDANGKMVWDDEPAPPKKDRNDFSCAPKRMGRPPKPGRHSECITIHMTPEDRYNIQMSADLTGVKISEFIRSAAREKAEQVVADR